MESDIPRCLKSTNLKNNAGIGCRTALNLARLGAKVIMACRSVERGEETRAKMEAELRCDNRGHAMPAVSGVSGYFGALKPATFYLLPSIDRLLTCRHIGNNADLFKNDYLQLSDVFKSIRDWTCPGRNPHCVDTSSPQEEPMYLLGVHNHRSACAVGDVSIEHHPHQGRRPAPLPTLEFLRY